MPDASVPKTGEKEGYYWLSVRTDARLLGQTVKNVPALFLGKVVAITLFDSGPLTPGDDEIAMGWHRTGDVLWTTSIKDPAVLPYAGWDEWYVFDKEKELPKFDVLTNYSSFRLDDLAAVLRENPNWDKSVLDFDMKLQDTFWRQVKILQPLSFLAENDAFFNFATREAALCRKVEECCRRHARF